MLEHYAIVKHLGDERHAELLLEASRLRMMPSNRNVIVCRVCRILGNFLVNMGNSLLKITIDAFETAK